MTQELVVELDGEEIVGAAIHNGLGKVPIESEAVPGVLERLIQGETESETIPGRRRSRVALPRRQDVLESVHAELERRTADNLATRSSDLVPVLGEFDGSLADSTLQAYAHQILERLRKQGRARERGAYNWVAVETNSTRH